MTGDPDRPPEPDRTRSPPQPRAHPPGVVTAWGVAGLVGGWLVHPVSEA